MELDKKKCIPCEMGGESLPQDQIEKNLEEVPNWKLSEKMIGREFEFKDFKEAMIEVMSHYKEAKLKSKKLFTKVNSSYRIKDVVKQYEKLYQSVEQ